MAVLPYDRSPSRLPVWLGAGGITVLVVVGIVIMGLPLQCDLGLSWDNTCPAGTAGASTMRPRAVSQPAGVAAHAPTVSDAAPVVPPVAASAQNLVAATFGKLGGAATSTPALASTPTAPASALATRVVKTLAVGPDGAVDNAQAAAPAAQPVPLAALPASTIANQAPAVSEAQAPEIATASSSNMPAISAAPVPLPVRAEHSALPKTVAQTSVTDGSVRVVGGSGVTVRSVPGKNGSRLFALSAGEHVTVVGTQHGWLRVTDAKGQTGWAYSSFFSGGRG